MINKQGIIFLTLTSLILVLSVYYVTMPTELLLTTNSLYNNKETVGSDSVKIENVTSVNSMKSILNDERTTKLKELNNKLSNKELSIDEKNNIYEEIKVINKLESMEEDIETIIKNEYKLDSFVKVDNDVIEIKVNNKKIDKKEAVKIISSIEKKYPNMYISVGVKE